MKMKKPRPIRTALDRAIASAGTMKALGKLCGVTEQAVHGWKKTGVPPLRCADVERFTGVPDYELRPDVFRKPVAR